MQNKGEWGDQTRAKRTPKKSMREGKEMFLKWKEREKKKRKTKTESVDLLMKNWATPTFKVGQILFESR